MIYRQWHHNNLTFGLWYAWTEHFILPFSHDEVVHMKGSMLNKMCGDVWQKFANLRALYAYMWAHPGKNLLFMGGELAQWREWNDDQSLDWHLLDEPKHAGVQRLLRDLNQIYKFEPALWAADIEPAGFQWLDANAATENVLAFLRIAPATGRQLVCVCNFSLDMRQSYRLALPRAGQYRTILNTDDEVYGGSGVVKLERIEAEAQALYGQDYSVALDLPPLATLWFEAP